MSDKKFSNLTREEKAQFIVIEEAMIEMAKECDLTYQEIIKLLKYKLIPKK